MTYYFIVYENRYKGEATGTISNTILEGIHPVIWLSSLPDVYKKYYTCFILFWEEISEEVKTEADKLAYVGINDETI